MTIAENLNRIEQAKADIKTAIESKGVYVDAADRIDVYAEKIASIEQGQGGGGECNLGVLEMAIIPETGSLYREASEDGLDGYSLVNVNAYDYGNRQHKYGQAFVLMGMGAGDGMSADSPYTVPQVIAYTYNAMQDKETQTTKDYFYIKGTVVSITSITENGRGTFNLGYKNQYEVEVYNSKYIDGQTFPSTDALKVGDIVVIKGRIQTSSYELYRIAGAEIVTFAESEDVVEQPPVNMKGLRFYNSDIETFEGYDLSEIKDYNRFFCGLPNFNMPITLNLEQDQDSTEMFTNVATNTEKGIDISIRCNGHTFNGQRIFNGSKLKRLPQITGLPDGGSFGEYAILGGCEIVNWLDSAWKRFPWGNLRDANCLFEGQSNLVTVPDLSLPYLEVANGMFSYCENLETVGNLSISNVGAFSEVFKGCNKLTSIGDLGNFENCWQFDNPFAECNNLITFPRMHNLKKSLNISNMVQLDTGLALLYIVTDFYNFTENGITPNDDEGVLTLPYYFQNDENWELRRDHLLNMGWRVEFA